MRRAPGFMTLALLLVTCLWKGAICRGEQNLLQNQGSRFTTNSTETVDSRGEDDALEVGDVAPAIQCLDDQGKIWDSRDHFGKKVVVLYFYPSDFAFCCTRQAIRYRDCQKEMAERGVEVVGVSGDDIQAHRLFKDAHGLKQALLADSAGNLAQQFGVPLRNGGKAMVKDANDRPVRDREDKAREIPRCVTAARWTFIIGKDGRILYREADVSPVKDSQKVLEFLRKNGPPKLPLTIRCIRTNRIANSSIAIGRRLAAWHWSWYLSMKPAILVNTLPLLPSFESHMNQLQADQGDSLERHRPYLMLLARSHLKPRHPRKLDSSDIVQQTLLDAFAKRKQFRGSTDAELAAWLREILKHNLADAIRDQQRDKRDIRREQSLEGAIDASFSRTQDWLAAVQSSPSQKAVRQEDLLRLSEGLTELPEAQREAIVLHHLQGLKLTDVAAEMDRSEAAVAGLLFRGLKALETILGE